MLRKLLVFFTAVVCFSQAAKAGDPPYIKTLDGAKNEIFVGAIDSLKDPVFFNPALKPSIQKINSVQNIVMLHLNEFSNTMLPDSFKVSVKVEITYTNINNQQSVIKDSVLSISYAKNKPYKSKAYLYFNNALSVSVKIISITPVYTTLDKIIKVLQLDNEMVVDRDYNMQCADVAIKTITANTDHLAETGELAVSWALSAVVEAYDLEWTYIDKTALQSGDYSIGGQLAPALIFKNNATRVTINGVNYKISLLYDGDGALFYRARGVQYLSTGERRTTSWSSDFIASGGLGRYDFGGHERKLNWQSDISFAEEGKRKAVVQYFDGSLLGRQTVTKDNTTNTTVVAETFYDKQGRPAIQVLPAPTLSSIIKYTPHFNTLNTAEYDKDVYDAAGQYCGAAAPAMDTATGAAQYYSPQNGDASNGIHKFIPNAYGYAFTETQYTQDATGRVAVQSGAGPDYRLNGNHATRYYYSTPSQPELDALFGTEAGIASHYQKNMVRDANGQYSVSYTDMTGKTVATALAGEEPVGLQALASNQKVTRTDPLLDASNNGIKGNTIESVKPLLVPAAGLHIFTYALTPKSLQLEDCGAQPICYDCLYDLEITITDDCNNQHLPGNQPYIFSKKNFTLGNIDTTCAGAPEMTASFSLTLPEGSYTVTKRLTVSKDAMDYYRDSIYTAHSACKSYADMYNRQRQLVLQRLGDCKQDSTESHTYASYREQMLLDLSPPSGQYADDSSKCSFSVFNNVYNDPSINYKDENGADDFITVERNGVPQLVRPNDLTKKEFSENFKSSWAAALLTRHPEWYLLQKYEALQGSHLWDEDFEKTDTYAKALAKGYLNPTGSNQQPAVKFPFIAAKADPLFSILAVQAGSSMASSAKQAVENYLFNVNGASSPSQAISAWGLATMSVKCPDATGPAADASCTQWSTAANAFNTATLCTGDLDMAWRIFRGLYAEKKRAWIDSYIRINGPQLNFNYSSSDPYACRPVFPETDKLLAAAGYPAGSSGQSQHDAGTAQAQNFYADNCQAYAQRWVEQLAPCNYTQADMAAILPQLIAVCKGGSDMAHPLGASSVAPGSLQTPKSFEEVIKAYNAAHGIAYNAACNAYLIDLPKPYEQAALVMNKPLYTKPDSCDCNRISSLYSEYNRVKNSYASFSKYLELRYHTHISNGALDSLRNLCNGTIQCKYMEHPIILPPALQCAVTIPCADCAKVKGLYDQYLLLFPGNAPAYLINEEAQQRAKNSLFERFMNNKLGFNKTTDEYLRFMDSCASMGNARPSGCDTLDKIYSDFNALRTNNKIYSGYKITKGAEELIAAADALVKASHNLNLTGGYGVAAYTESFTAPLRSLTPIPASGGQQFSAVVPLPLSNTYSSADLAANTVVAADFINNTASAADLADKHYGITLVDRIRCLQGIWTGKNSGAFNYYGVSTTLNKYLPAQSLENHSYGATFFTLPASVTDAGSFEQFYTSGQVSGNVWYVSPLSYIISLQDIKGIRNLRFATEFGTALGSAGVNSPRFLKVTLDMADGSVKDAYWWANYDDNRFVVYKEAIDTALTQNDCTAAFTYYFNRQRGTAYSYQQIKDLYQDSCGKTIAPCGGACDSTWAVYNSGANLNVNADLYNNAVNNIASRNQFFDGDYFHSEAAAAITHYVLVDKKRSVNTGSDTAVTMQWRLKPEAGAYVYPFVLSGSQSWLGATWAKDITDTTWLIATTRITGRNSTLYGIGVSSNAHALQADWVKITAGNGAVLYFDDFKNICPADDSGSLQATGPLLCGTSEAWSRTLEPENEGPCADSARLTQIAAMEVYRAYRDSLKNAFNDSYLQKCLGAASIESFTVTAPVQEYHYTLYYYDQAGSLVKTVAPEGVHPVNPDAVRAARLAGTDLVPLHTGVTTYRYNSLGQVVSQQSPDGGLSSFWYDRLGRLAVSQNARQKTEGKWSYTLYDALGRITEVGQKVRTIAMTDMTDAISRNAAALAGWLAAASLTEQVTRTVYDDPATVVPPFNSTAAGFKQKTYTLRNRVSYTQYYQTLSVTGNYNSATYYSYDIHGNVDTLLQEYRLGLMAAHGVNRYKLMAYQYDLISGKVNAVHYQPGERDQLYHRYEYDAENRITDVYTTDQKGFTGLPNMEDHEAFYQYYKHGPLARAVIGGQQVQGLDYVYTLQGWLKGVNGLAQDMGGDGRPGSIVARDAISYQLNYFTGDYSPVGQGSPFPGHSGFMSSGEYKPLYNGNISSMAVSIPKLGETKLYNYGYDQLNRLVSMDTWKGFTAANNWNGLQKTDEYKERISYDANGNILTYLRNGNAAAGLPMDALTYGYNKTGSGSLLNNRLRHVKDAVADLNGYTEDIKTQGDDNYGYDAIGNLIKDTKEKITAIDWSVYGKILSITKAATVTGEAERIDYTYDASGNRISKVVKKRGIAASDYTWYVRDASGNVMAVYTYSGSTVSNSVLSLSEQHLYGSGRLGIWNHKMNMDAVLPVPNNGSLIGAINAASFDRGYKSYELSNHLGNVLATVSDRKLSVSTNGTTVDYYVADVVSAQDYYPFGMIQPGRNSSSTGSYRYGFNGKENDNEVKGEGNQISFEARVYDPRVGRFLSPDPLEANYSSQSTYAFAANNPISLIDYLGLGPDDPPIGKASDGRNINIPNDATVEYNGKTKDGKDIITTTQNSKVSVNIASGSIYAINTKAGRFVASYGEDGNFVGYKNYKTGEIMKSFATISFEATGVVINTKEAIENIGGGKVTYNAMVAKRDKKGSTYDFTEKSVIGTLWIRAHYDDGTSKIINGYDFTSGPHGNGPLPNGEYDVNGFSWTSQPGMKLNGGKQGFKLFLTDRPDLGRSAFRIHPDCNSWGTSGCIGLRGNNGKKYNNVLLKNFAASMKDYRKSHPVIKLSFQIPNNPNYADQGKKAPGN